MPDVSESLRSNNKILEIAINVYAYTLSKEFNPMYGKDILTQVNRVITKLNKIINSAVQKKIDKISDSPNTLLNSESCETFIISKISNSKYDRINIDIFLGVDNDISRVDLSMIINDWQSSKRNSQFMIGFIIPG